MQSKKSEMEFIDHLQSVSNLTDPVAQVDPKFLQLTHAQSTKLINPNFYLTHDVTTIVSVDAF